MIGNIQSCLVPRRPASRFGGVEIAHTWEPLDEIGGDFLYYERVSERFLSVEIGDVTGHGTHAGLVMTALHGLIFGMRRSADPVEQILANANTFLCRLQQLETARDPTRVARMLMASMFLLRLDFETRAVTYCNAGHPAGLYAIPGPDCEILSLRTGGPILGAVPSAAYRTSRMRPMAGDVILLYTDGVSEATNDAEDEFGTSRLQILLRDLAGLKPRRIVEEITQRVSDFRGKSSKTDDVAVAVLKFLDNW